MWNTLSSLKEQVSNNVERELITDESDQTCYMVQGNESLEVTSESHLDDCASSFNNLKVHLEGVNRCKANLMINDAELKINCNTLSVTKECSRIPGEGL